VLIYKASFEILVTIICSFINSLLLHIFQILAVRDISHCQLVACLVWQEIWWARGTTSWPRLQLRRTCTWTLCQRFDRGKINIFISQALAKPGRVCTSPAWQTDWQTPRSSLAIVCIECMRCILISNCQRLWKPNGQLVSVVTNKFAIEVLLHVFVVLLF